ncbi:helix-turn-helix domain-containing protein [Streptosporangium saharense]|uniref:helix-turn-helix domain-containing protein n=1 Tax=Streptosporangium saharense TaxID=1706840 RepID=UPI0033305871
MPRHIDPEESSSRWHVLAEAVKDRRRALGIPTQKAAADLAGFSLNTWQRLESGKQISLTSLSAVAAALQWAPSYPTAILKSGRKVVGGTDSTPPHPALSAGHDLTIAGGPTVVTVLPEDDVPPEQPQMSTNTNVVMVPLIVPRDVFNNLDEDDVRWLVNTVMRHGRELASTISDARRIGRIKQQQSCGDA